MSSTFEDIKKNNYLLTPSKYVGFSDEIDDEISSEQRITNLINDYKKLVLNDKQISDEVEKNIKFLKNIYKIT